FDGSSATKQSDIYATGVLLFYLVTGVFPVQAASYEELRQHHLRGIRRKLVDIRPDLPDGFVRIVDKMLAPDPVQRYTSANEVREALEAFVAPNVVASVRRLPAWARAVVGIGAFAGVIGLIGFIACRYFEVVIGIGADFAAGPRDYLN